MNTISVRPLSLSTPPYTTSAHFSVLESLPLEVFWEIGKHLPYISLLALCMTNHNISTRVYACEEFAQTPGLSPNENADLRLAELFEIEKWSLYNTEITSTFEPERRCFDLFTCLLCRELRPRNFFSCKMVKRPYSKQGQRQVERYCIACGFSNGKHQSGNIVSVAGSELKIGKCLDCGCLRRAPLSPRDATRWGPCIACHFKKKAVRISWFEIMECIVRYFNENDETWDMSQQGRYEMTYDGKKIRTNKNVRLRIYKWYWACEWKRGVY